MRAVSSDDFAETIEPLERTVDVSKLCDYRRVSEGNSGTIVLLEHYGRGQYSPDGNVALSRYRTLLELGRLGIENVFVRTTDKYVRGIDANKDLVKARDFVRNFFDNHKEPSRDELEFLALYDESTLFHFLHTNARLTPCSNGPSQAAVIKHLCGKIRDAPEGSKKKPRHDLNLRWAHLASVAFCRLPPGSAGVHVHSASYFNPLLYAMRKQERKFDVYFKSFR